jgi:hypothetical protein
MTLETRVPASPIGVKYGNGGHFALLMRFSGGIPAVTANGYRFLRVFHRSMKRNVHAAQCRYSAVFCGVIDVSVNCI